MSDLNVEEFDLHPSFISDTVWPVLIGDRPLWKKASTWCIIFGVLIAFLFGAIVVLLNGNEQQLELLVKLEKNVQQTIISAFENKHNVIANEIEEIINASIEHHFLKLAIIVGIATVLILTTVKVWEKFKIALNERNTPQTSEVKMVEEPEANNDVNDNGGQQLLMVDDLAEERSVREEEKESTDEEEETKHEEEEEESTDEEKEESTDEEEKEVMEKNLRTTHADEGKKFKCTECTYQTARSNHLKRHMRAHTGERPFKCAICGHQTARSEHLKVHMHTHTGEKPFECTICGHQTTRSEHLKEHMRTHTGEKPFKCTECTYQTARSNHLKRHMRAHTGERPFKCTICGHQTARSEQLKVHMRTHTVCNLRPSISTLWRFEKAHAHSHRCETLQMYNLRPSISTGGKFETAHAAQSHG